MNPTVPTSVSLVIHLSHAKRHKLTYQLFELPRDAIHKRALCRRTASVRPSVRLSIWVSVTLVYSVETSEHIFKFFSPSGSYTILVFRRPTKRHGNILTGPSDSRDVVWRWGTKRWRFSTNISLRRVLSTMRPSDVINIMLPEFGQGCARGYFSPYSQRYHSVVYVFLCTQIFLPT